MNEGRFITVEGVEGVGKSTNIDFIQAQLSDRGIDPIVTREPGGTLVGERIRDILLDVSHQSLSSQVELLLMFAARAQHVDELIKPALADGKWVVCDRFTDSTYAYQGGGRGVAIDLIASLEQSAIQGFSPDHTLLLDLDPEIGLARASRLADKDRFESEEVSFFNAVRSTFLDRAQAEPGRIHVIDASASLEDVQANIVKWLDQLC